MCVGNGDGEESHAEAVLDIEYKNHLEQEMTRVSLKCCTCVYVLLIDFSIAAAHLETFCLLEGSWPQVWVSFEMPQVGLHELVT